MNKKYTKKKRKQDVTKKNVEKFGLGEIWIL